MKDQYLIGVKEKDFIRVSDGTFATMCTRTLDDAQRVQKSCKGKLKVFKLVEVKE